jgi:hypothetical protein
VPVRQGADPVGWGVDLAANILMRRYRFLCIRIVCVVWQNKNKKTAKQPLIPPEVHRVSESAMGEIQSVIRKNLVGALLGLLCTICLNSSPVAAQNPVAADNAPLDVLYAQSHILAFPDQDWPYPHPTDPLFSTDTGGISFPMETVRSLRELRLREMDSNFPDKRPSESSPAASNLKNVWNDNENKIHWWTATKESLLYTGTMHVFDITTEAGTRDTLNGPLLRNYFRSVSELRGWSDSDAFMAPYVGHPIEGGAFGFIFRQNDPKYKTVQWGDGRAYYISLLRSMAYSAVWHTQWKIGPFSEASIGNVMLHASPGFITLVDTPTLGTLEMIGEDTADRYLIMGIENRTANRMIIIMARSFLNPARSVANMTAFHVPWRRDTRMGIDQTDFAVRKELLEDYKAGIGSRPFVFSPRSSEAYGMEFEQHYPLAAPIELMAAPHYESFLGGGSCVGAGGTGAARINNSWQIVAEVSGCLIMHIPAANQSGDSLLYAVGPRWTPWSTRKISPYLQMMVGGRKVTHETDDLALRTKLLQEWDDGEGTLAHYPLRSAWSAENSQNGAVITTGGGVDWVITRPFAWRVLNVEYTHTWMPNVDMISPQNSVRITTGALLRIGTW